MDFGMDPLINHFGNKRSGEKWISRRWVFSKAKNILRTDEWPEKDTSVTSFISSLVAIAAFKILRPEVCGGD